MGRFSQIVQWIQYHHKGPYKGLRKEQEDQGEKEGSAGGDRQRGKSCVMEGMRQETRATRKARKHFL